VRWRIIAMPKAFPVQNTLLNASVEMGFQLLIYQSIQKQDYHLNLHDNFKLCGKNKDLMINKRMQVVCKAGGK